MSEADRLLAPLADWMHEHADRGLIRHEKAYDQLLDFCAARHGKPKDYPDVTREVDDFWKRITHDTSVFVERSPGEYAFLHLTFEEYWAARYLVRDFNKAPDLINARRHNPRFTEVIQLAIASQTDENASHLIRSAIWCTPDQAEQFGYQASQYEDILRRDLFLAARCIRDCNSVDPALAKTVAEEMVAICLNVDDKGRATPLMARAKEVLAATPGSAVHILALTSLIAASKDEDSTIRRVAIHALGSAGQGSPETIQVLIHANKDEDSDVRYAAVGALGKVGQGSPETIQALIHALKDEDSDVREAAWTAFDKLASS